MSVVPSSYCAAGVDQEKLAGRNFPVGGAGDAVVNDGAVRSGARDRRKRNVLQNAGVAAERFQRLDGVDLGQLAARCFLVEPCEEARHGGAVAALSLVRAFDLHRIFHGFHQRDRIGAAGHLAAGGGNDAGQCVGAGRLVEPDGALGKAERGEIARERGRLSHRRQFLDLVPHRVAELAALDIERRSPVLGHDGKGERDRRVRDVGAADVERPGEGVRIRDHQRVGTRRGDLGADPGELGVGVFAGVAEIVQRHRAGRRLRPVAPQSVDAGWTPSQPLWRRRWRRLWQAVRRRPRCAATGRNRTWRLSADWPRSIAQAACPRSARSRTPRHRPGYQPAACSGHRRTAPLCRRAPPRSRPSR